MKAIAVYIAVFLVFMAIATLIRSEEQKLATRSCAEYKGTFVKIDKPPFHSVWECVKIVRGK